MLLTWYLPFTVFFQLLLLTHLPVLLTVDVSLFPSTKMVLNLWVPVRYGSKVSKYFYLFVKNSLFLFLCTVLWNFKHKNNSKATRRKRIQYGVRISTCVVAKPLLKWKFMSVLSRTYRWLLNHDSIWNQPPWILVLFYE